MCEDLAELRAFPCNPCLAETLTPPWEQKSRRDSRAQSLSEPKPGKGRAKRNRSGA
jgi:hypothetical protein